MYPDVKVEENRPYEEVSHRRKDKGVGGRKEQEIDGPKRSVDSSTRTQSSTSFLTRLRELIPHHDGERGESSTAGSLVKGKTLPEE